MKNLITVMAFTFLLFQSNYAQELNNHIIHFTGTKENKLKICVSFSGKNSVYLNQVRTNLSEIYRSRDFSISFGDNDCSKKTKIKGYCLFQPRDVKPDELTTKFHFYKDFDFNLNKAKLECTSIAESYSGYALVKWIDQKRTWSGI